ncbi:MAG: exosortase-associated EpsI family protein [Armatimonadota bacterium]
MDAPRTNRTVLTRDRAKVIVLALLLAALGLGYYERREIPADDIPLGDLPAQIDSWEMVSEDTSLTPDGSCKLLVRTYRNADGREAHVRAQATYTRLGSLRDWSLAAMAQGWHAAEQTTWHSGDGVMDARIERLVNEPNSQIALTWYTSARSQAPSLKRAEMLGARDRLLGNTKPWASLYVIASGEDAGKGRQAVEDLASALGPRLQDIMAESRPG